MQWRRRCPRATDQLALPVWFDAAGGDEERVWAATLEAATGQRWESLQVLVFGGDHHLARLALRSGFAATEELSGTTWMDAGQRPPVAHVEGFSVVDRTLRKDRPHPMIACNGDLVEGRLRRCSPYDPTLDLTVEDAEGKVAGYALFWFDPVTLVGLVEPMRVEDDYQRTQPLRRGRLRPDICRPTLRPASTARTVGLTGPSRRIDDHRRGSPQLPGRNGSSEEDTRRRRQSGGTRGESHQSPWRATPA